MDVEAEGRVWKVSEQENATLQATLGDLDQSISVEDLKYNLGRVNDTILDIAHGAGKGPPRMNIPKPSYASQGGQMRRNAPEAEAEQQAPEAITEDDILTTMKARNMTREQVIQQLKAQGSM